MMKYFKFFEYAYLVFAALLIFETIRLWHTEPSRSYLYAFMAVVAIFMYIFKRNFRKRYEKRKNQ